MKHYFVIPLLLLTVIIAIASSCKRPQTATADTSNYPPEISNIILNNCAISGCHDAASYTNCDNLLLDTWEHLFQGGTDGASVIPYCTTYSPFLYYVNNDSTTGTIDFPTMPISTPGRTLSPLSNAQYQTLRNWIANGAPDKNGNVPFASNPDTRQKIYITQQGCGIVAVVDAESKQIMRYIEVDVPPGIVPSQSPHVVVVSGDGMNGYVTLFAGTYVQKFDTRIDAVTGQDDLASLIPGLGTGGWSIIKLSPLDTAMVVTAYQPAGLMAYINPVNMTTVYNTGNGSLVYPHGVESNAAFDTFYICEQFGNSINIFTRNAFPFWDTTISIVPGVPATQSTAQGVTPDPHVIKMTPDYSKYFVTCQQTNEVRVMDTHADTLIAAIPVGAKPQEMDMSKTYPYLFVVCMNDENNPIPGRIGSVYVINYNTNQVVDILYGDFYEPHDVTVDELYGQVFVISTNYSGIAHHVTACGGSSGWYTVYNLYDLLPADNNRYTMTNFSYASCARFK